jgi:hypothetical protein
VIKEGKIKSDKDKTNKRRYIGKSWEKIEQ